MTFWRYSIRRVSSFSQHFVVSDAVKTALNSKKGVVALESTVITHGLPYPQNLETARLLEEEVKSEGSVPATIAILDGKVHIGLSSAELQRVSDSMDSIKVSRRDIPYALVKNVLGGTTVAATMYLSHLAGIQVFATGGIGGVHRGADQTFDISADLLELARTPVTVVCAGVKSILDIPKTVEFLETHSVNNIVFGDKNVFPGFFSAKTDSKAQFNTEDLQEVASVIKTSQSLGLDAGTVLACPIPAKFEADGKIIESAIEQALREADELHVKSQQITPFLLKRVNELTEGASMKTNISLLQNNARIGGGLARILAEEPLWKAANRENSETSKPKPKIAVIGATILDYEAITQADVKDDGGSYVGVVTQRCGGVARNHADALSRLGCDVKLISAVGEDAHAKYIYDNCRHMDMSCMEKVKDVPTAVYMSMNIKGNVRYGVSSIGDIVERISSQVIIKNEETIATSKYLLLDGNLPLPTLKQAVDTAKQHKVPVWYEPTDILKATKIVDCNARPMINAISPNANEFRMLCERFGIKVTDDVVSSPERTSELILNNSQIMHNLDFILVSLSVNGSTTVKREQNGELSVINLPAPSPAGGFLKSVSGAGDSLNSGILAGLVHGLPWKRCLSIGQKCASLTLSTTDAVSSQITPDLLK